MALFDLADVTRTIIHLIEIALQDTHHWAPLAEPKVMADLPNRVKKDGLGFYLFHVQESGYYKNIPAPGKNEPPVAYTPMGLNLFYQLSANVIQDDGGGPLAEQLLMGIAMKALHDNPELADTVPPGNNRCRITLQTLSPSEAVQYWTAGESPVKLSAFYQVSVIFLEPKQTTMYTGRVLSYGNYVFARTAPQISSSQNTISYFLPGDPTPHEVVIQPAQVPPATVLPPAPQSIISFFGSGFGGGVVELWIIDRQWPDTAVATPDWQVKVVHDGLLTAIVRPAARLRDTGVAQDILPGLYAARISITEQRTLPDGTVKTFQHVSNQYPFSVTPFISGVANGVGGAFIITGWLFQYGGQTIDDMAVYLGETRLAPDTGAFNAGEFKVTSPSTLELKPPGGLPAGPTPLRIMIYGCESPPRWIILP